MARYRKKPVEVEAWKWKGGKLYPDDLMSPCPRWVAEAIDRRVVERKGEELVIRTLEGDHLARVGDYIIRGVKGELYPCKPDIFKQTYEVVE